ncbi:MAG: hypothetical protein ACAF41_29540 [Leptolyngbya sp. BL-A-14]
MDSAAQSANQNSELKTQNSKLSSLIPHPPSLIPYLNGAFTLRVFHSSRSEVASVNCSGLAIGGLFIHWYGVVWKNA